MNIKRIKYLSLDQNKSKVYGIKSPIIWACENRQSYPIAYLKKPKHLSQEEFEDILNRIEIKFNISI